MANAIMGMTNKVWLRGFLSAQKLQRVSEKITSIAATLEYDFIDMTISSYGGDATAIANFVEAVKVIPKIKFRVKIEKAGPEGEFIASALGEKS